MDDEQAFREEVIQQVAESEFVDYLDTDLGFTVIDNGVRVRLWTGDVFDVTITQVTE